MQYVIQKRHPDTPMDTMYMRTPTDLGALIRDRRKKLREGQDTLAKKIGVSRQWVVAIEHGNAGAELGLVLRALDSLGIRLQSAFEPELTRGSPAGADIDAIIESARTSKR